MLRRRRSCCSPDAQGVRWRPWLRAGRGDLAAILAGLVLIFRNRSCSQHDLPRPVRGAVLRRDRHSSRCSRRTSSMSGRMRRPAAQRPGFRRDGNRPAADPVPPAAPCRKAIVHGGRPVRVAAIVFGLSRSYWLSFAALLVWAPATWSASTSAAHWCRWPRPTNCAGA
jgi:hypothetical protein